MTGGSRESLSPCHQERLQLFWFVLSFFQLLRRGFNFSDLSSVSFSFRYYVSFSCHDWSKDVKIMEKKDMMQSALQPWNVEGSLPLHQWLTSEQTELDRQRLKCLGNIVMPRCAKLGLHQLEHELRANGSKWYYFNTFMFLSCKYFNTWVHWSQPLCLACRWYLFDFQALEQNNLFSHANSKMIACMWQWLITAVFGRVAWKCFSTSVMFMLQDGPDNLALLIMRSFCIDVTGVIEALFSFYFLLPLVWAWLMDLRLLHTAPKSFVGVRLAA